MQTCPIRTVAAHWESLRRNRTVPLRTDLDPRRIDSALEYTFILERVAPGLARFRLAGRHLTEMVGTEVRGMPLSALFTSSARAPLAEALAHLFEEPATVRFRLRAEGGLGRPKLRADLLLLPLISDLGDTSRAIGCLVGEGRIGLAPRRFAIEHQEIVPVDGAAATSPVMARHPLSTARPEFAERPAIYAARPAPKPARAAQAIPLLHPAERPYLRLVRPET
ncbi:MAG: PAS domain-containing protein [Qingshengfaniella sp.]